MAESPNLILYRHITAHAPVTAAAIAAGLALALAEVERSIDTLLSIGLIGVAGHDPGGAPLYAPLDS